MLPDERYVTVEDAARQMHIQSITLRRWLATGTMLQFEFDAMGYVLQADVDAFNEACQWRNQKVYRPKLVQTATS